MGAPPLRAFPAGAARPAMRSEPATLGGLGVGGLRRLPQVRLGAPRRGCALPEVSLDIERGEGRFAAHCGAPGIIRLRAREWRNGR